MEYPYVITRQGIFRRKERDESWTVVKLAWDVHCTAIARERGLRRGDNRRKAH